MYRLRRYLASLDPTVSISTLALVAIGWLLVLSASLPTGQESLFPLPLVAVKQALWIMFGLAVLIAASLVDYHVLLRLAPWFYGLALLLLALVLGIGHTSFGARRWFSLGAFFVQPGELSKLAVLMLVSRTIGTASVRTHWSRWLGVTLAMAAVPMALIMGQPNLGTAMLLFVGVLAVWVAAGVPWLVFGAAATALAGCAPFVWMFLKDYQKARLLNFWNPYRDPLGGGYSVIQSTIAIGSGGVFGRGYTLGPQNRLEFIPKHHTDFIASVLGEEFGWVGAAVVLIIYLFLFLGGLKIAHRSRDLAGSYLVVGIVSLMIFQTLINLGMNMGLVPVTGLPLPLLSYGGSSLIVTSFFLGIVLNVERQRRH